MTLRLKGIMAVLAVTAAGLTSTVAAQDRAGWPSSIKIGTASQGGTYFIYGSGVAKLIQEQLSIPASAEVSGGPIQNLALIDAGRMHLGLTSAGPAQQSMEGQNPLLSGRKTENVRALFPMYQSAFQIAVLKSSGILDLQGLNGKSLGVGPKAGTTATYLPMILSDIGVNVDPRYGGAGDQAGQLQDGMIASLGLAAGIPVTAFTQIEAQNEITPLGFSLAEIEKLTDFYPSLSPLVIEKGTYKNQTEDLNTVSMWNFVVASKDMPDDLAYAITKAVLENNDAMKQVHRAAEESLAEHITKNAVVPLHPGAARYYQEQGITLSPELLSD